MNRHIFGRAVIAPALLAITASAAAQHDFSSDKDDEVHTVGMTLGNAAVYSMTNEAEGNRIAVFDRDNSGELSEPRLIPTGGLGSGDGLGNQGALEFARGDFVIYAVNAGSNTISVFIDPPFIDPILIQQMDSQGERPVSVDVAGNRLFVVNAGGAVGGVDSIAGFRIGPIGLLTPMDDTVRPLSADSTGPAQIAVSRDRQHLVVTEKATNTITVFNLDGDGRPGMPIPQASVGATPFGFMIDRHGNVVVSEAFGGEADVSAVSTYSIANDGTLNVIEASVPTNETAACWVALTNNGRYAYTTNTADSSVTGFALSSDGSHEILDKDGRTALTGDGGQAPTDAIVLRSRYLFVLNRAAGEVVSYFIHNNGSLEQVDATMGIPGSPTGLIVR